MRYYISQLGTGGKDCVMSREFLGSVIVIPMADRNVNYKCQKPHFAHATTIYRNTPTHYFTGENKALLILSGPTIQHVTFLLKYKDRQFCL